jgi:hypothetical protein
MIDPWGLRQPFREWRQIVAIDDIPNLASKVPACAQRFGEFLLLIGDLEVNRRHQPSFALIAVCDLRGASLSLLSRRMQGVFTAGTGNFFKGSDFA